MEANVQNQQQSNRQPNQRQKPRAQKRRRQRDSMLEAQQQSLDLPKPEYLPSLKREG